MRVTRLCDPLWMKLCKRRSSPQTFVNPACATGLRKTSGAPLNFATSRARGMSVPRCPPCRLDLQTWLTNSRELSGTVRAPRQPVSGADIIFKSHPALRTSRVRGIHLHGEGGVRTAQESSTNSGCEEAEAVQTEGPQVLGQCSACETTKSVCTLSLESVTLCGQRVSDGGRM
jgi:hypothetical protein